jgi:hypothetical protein
LVRFGARNSAFKTHYSFQSDGLRTVPDGRPDGAGLKKSFVCESVIDETTPIAGLHCAALTGRDRVAGLTQGGAGGLALPWALIFRPVGTANEIGQEAAGVEEGVHVEKMHQ